MEENEINEDSGPNKHMMEDDCVHLFKQTENDLSSDTNIEWNDSIFIWDLAELQSLNIKREQNKEPTIPIILRTQDQDLGLRAHPEMSIGKCIYSLILIHQNEFPFIWLFLGFAIYFWVQVGILGARSDQDFNNDDTYKYMLIANIAAGTTVLFTAVYLTFYSISSKVQKVLQLFNRNF
jgi:hypothetical protein